MENYYFLGFKFEKSPESHPGNPVESGLPPGNSKEETEHLAKSNQEGIGSPDQSPDGVLVNSSIGGNSGHVPGSPADTRRALEKLIAGIK